MTDVLIVYATRHGQTAKIAGRIAETLNARSHKVRVVDADQVTEPLDLIRFQRVLVVAPIHAGGYPKSIVRFAHEHREQLTRAPSAFLSVGLALLSRTSDGQAQTLKVFEKFVQHTGWRPSRVELVAGALPYSKYNFIVRFVMRRISAGEGGDTDTARDYEYTDWQALSRLTLELVEGDSPARGSNPPGTDAVPAHAFRAQT
jgi:menaquinone-dependent protoporphyrinogen oxidase